MDDKEKWLTTDDVAARLNRAPKTIQLYRSRGIFPIPHTKMGCRVWYLERDVEEYISKLPIDAKGNFILLTTNSALKAYKGATQG